MSRSRQHNFKTPITVERHPDDFDHHDFGPPGTDWETVFEDRAQIAYMGIADRVEANELYAGVNATLAVRWSSKWSEARKAAGGFRVRAAGLAEMFYVRGIVPSEDGRYATLYCVSDDAAISTS